MIRAKSIAVGCFIAAAGMLSAVANAAPVQRAVFPLTLSIKFSFEDTNSNGSTRITTLTDSGANILKILGGDDALNTKNKSLGFFFVDEEGCEAQLVFVDTSNMVPTAKPIGVLELCFEEENVLVVAEPAEGSAGSVTEQSLGTLYVDNGRSTNGLTGKQIAFFTDFDFDTLVTQKAARKLVEGELEQTRASLSFTGGLSNYTYAEAEEGGVEKGLITSVTGSVNFKKSVSINVEVNDHVEITD